MEGREVAAVLAEMIVRICRGQAHRAQLVAELRELAAAVERGGAAAAGGLRQPAAGEGPAEPDGMHRAWGRIFRHWQRVMDHPRAVPTAERRRKVLARLREGYTEHDIMRAIDGCAASGYHMGENDQGTRYDDLTLICRSGSKLEQFLAVAGYGPDRQPELPMYGPDAEIERLQCRADQALRDGRQEDYADINRRIAQLRSHRR